MLLGLVAGVSLTNREHLVTALKKAVEEHQTGNTELKILLGEAKAKVPELRDRAKRTYLDRSEARSDSERAMTREAYDAVHEELTRAEYAQERLEADLVLRGIANEDQTTSALAYLERFDRFSTSYRRTSSGGPSMPSGWGSTSSSRRTRSAAPDDCGYRSVAPCPSDQRWLGGTRWL